MISLGTYTISYVKFIASPFVIRWSLFPSSASARSPVFGSHAPSIDESTEYGTTSNPTTRCVVSSA